MGQVVSKKKRNQNATAEKKPFHAKVSEFFTSGCSSGKDDLRQRNRAPSIVDSTVVIRDIAPDPEVGEMLQNVPIFSHLNQTEREKLGGALEEVRFDAGDVICAEGDAGDCFYIVQSGTALVTKYDPSTGEHIFLIELTAGDHFGEQAILSDTEQLVSVTANSEITLWALQRKTFKVLFRENRIDLKFAVRDDLPIDPRGAVSSEGEERFGGSRSAEYSGPFPSQTLPEETEELLLRAINNNVLFSTFEEDHMRTVALVMDELEVKAGDDLIKEGEEGDSFYIVTEGEFDVFQYRDGQQEKVDHKSTGDSFGELALMYEAPRNATVQAVCDSKVRVLERVWFNRIAKALGMARLEQYAHWLNKIELLAPLTNYERNQVAEALEVVDIAEPNVDIFRQGDEGDALYIVVKGEVVFTKEENGAARKEIGRCSPGQYFGERALINNEPRAANATTLVCTRLVRLDRGAFVSLLGPLEEIIKKKVDRYDPNGDPLCEWDPLDVKREDLKKIGILGQGSYGVVTLVSDPEGRTFALKAVSKQRIVETKQKDHIYNEKILMTQMNHPFLIKLYQTYQDRDRLFFLLEPSLGGELFPILRRNKTFPPSQAKFYAASVCLAFEYMHKRNFIYRDLKPENLLLDRDGYLKITDFGFCKKVPHKTWTMCGTPEYMAPEIISHNGHGKAVDWWCLGIFIFEMLASYTPFYGKGGNMKMYERIVRGTFNVPSHINRDAKSLIRALLRTRPHMRLGMLKEGPDGIKSHPWFQGFDWQALLWRKLKAPHIPKVKDINDVSNFKQDVKQMAVKPYIDDGTQWDIDF